MLHELQHQPEISLETNDITDSSPDRRVNDDLQDNQVIKKYHLRSSD